MSDENKTQDVSETVANVAQAELAIKHELNSKPAETTEVKVKDVDPYLMLLSIESLRKEGVAEEDIRAAFNEYMNERKGIIRKPQKTVKNPDAVKMPTQEEINKIYTDRVTEATDKTVLSLELQTLLEEIEKAQERKKLIEASKNKVTLKMRWYRVLYYGLNKFLSFVVWVFNKAGIK